MRNLSAGKMFWAWALVFGAIFSWNTAWAQFYVIAVGQKARQTILVSPKSTQTASGTALLAALDGITDASSANRYLIIIEPGIYNIEDNSLQMKPYVDIQGSGERVTLIKGNVDNDRWGVIKGAHNSELRFLTVYHSGGVTDAIAISNHNASPKITNVTATAINKDSNSWGVYNVASSPTMTHVTAIAKGYSSAYGVGNDGGSSPIMVNVTAEASKADENYGVFNFSSSPTMTGVTATAKDGTHCYGVYNHTHASPTMMNVTAAASMGTYNWGVYNKNASTVKIDHSVISGSTGSITNTLASSTQVANTRLEGGGIQNDHNSSCTCAGVYDGSYNFYAGTCP